MLLGKIRRGGTYSQISNKHLSSIIFPIASFIFEPFKKYYCDTIHRCKWEGYGYELIHNELTDTYLCPGCQMEMEMSVIENVIIIIDLLNKQ